VVEQPSGDQEFLRSIFLMEAWDTLVAIEDGMARLTGGGEPAQVSLEHGLVVDAQHGLGNAIGEPAEARAAARR